MGTKNNPGKFDCHAAAEPDEPTFTLLGRDPMAGAIVRAWATMREQAGEDPAKVQEARDVAVDMDQWAKKLGKEPHHPRAAPQGERVMFDFAKPLAGGAHARPRSPCVDVEAIRTNACTGEVKYVTVQFYVEYVASNLNEHYLYLEGGPTGYESMPVASIATMLHNGHGWCACMGTEGRWDRMVIQAAEFKRAAMIFLVETTCESCHKRMLVMPSDDVPATFCPPCGGECTFGGFVEEEVSP